MNKRNLVKYSKFYVQLEKLENELRDAVNLGRYLKVAEPELFKNSMPPPVRSPIILMKKMAALQNKRGASV